MENISESSQKGETQKVVGVSRRWFLMMFDIILDL